MECHKQENELHCNCTYEPCPRKGRCCQCVVYHRNSGELPACFFPGYIEMTYDRSFSRFAAAVNRGEIK